MSPNQDLAVDLAQEIDAVLGTKESVLAPAMMDAYLAGGRRRAALFQRAEAGVASFGGGATQAILPTILHWAQGAAESLLKLLASEGLSTFVKALSIGAAVVDIFGKARPSADVDKEEGHSDLLVADDELRTFERVRTELEAALRAAGLEEHQRQQVCRRVLLVLLRSPDASRSFLIAARGL